MSKSKPADRHLAHRPAERGLRQGDVDRGQAHVSLLRVGDRDARKEVNKILGAIGTRSCTRRKRRRSSPGRSRASCTRRRPPTRQGGVRQQFKEGGQPEEIEEREVEKNGEREFDIVDLLRDSKIAPSRSERFDSWNRVASASMGRGRIWRPWCPRRPSPSSRSASASTRGSAGAEPDDRRAAHRRGHPVRRARGHAARRRVGAAARARLVERFAHDEAVDVRPVFLVAMPEATSEAGYLVFGHLRRRPRRASTAVLGATYALTGHYREDGGSRRSRRRSSTSASGIVRATRSIGSIPARCDRGARARGAGWPHGRRGKSAGSDAPAAANETAYAALLEGMDEEVTATLLRQTDPTARMRRSAVRSSAIWPRSARTPSAPRPRSAFRPRGGVSERDDSARQMRALGTSP